MASPLAIGAGASEGLDNYLTRLLMESQVAETQRAHKASEGLHGRELDQQEGVRRSLEEERQGVIDERKRLTEAEKVRQANEESVLSDPTTPETVRSYLKLRRVVPKGENVPYQIFQSPGGNVTGQQHTYKITDAALAKQLGKKVGDPIDAMLTPKGEGVGKITYRGVDVTSGVDHYEKPPAPDRVLIQSESGYIPRETARRTLEGGGSVPLATTSSTRTMQEGASMLRPHINELSQMADQLDRAGLFGPMMSRIRHIGEKVGTIDDFYDAVSSDPDLKQLDPLVGEFASSLGLLATGAGRVHGGARGGGSPQMFAHFKSMLADVGSAEMFKGRLKGVDKYMKTYEEGPGGGKGGKPAGNTGGVPEVGGTFNGGKVLKVTPIQ